MESNHILLEKIHELIERKNSKPPKKKPHEIFDLVREHRKPVTVGKKKKKKLPKKK
jgi:hypothetical protein